MTEHMNRVN